MSRLHFLGTGAADWSKEYADRPDYRGLTSILLDDSILIDLTGCYDYIDRNNMCSLLSKVDTVLITHSHSDHYSKEVLSRLCRENCDRTITLYGSPVLEPLLPDNKNLRFVPLDSRFQPHFSLHDYQVTALSANHATTFSEEQAMHYFLKKDGKSLFAGFDGGWLLADTWEFLQKNSIDVYLIDSTVGENDVYNFRNFSHNNAQMRDFLCNTMRRNGVLTESSVVIQTHLARTLHPEHSTLSAQSAQKGFLTAYDGWTFEF